MSQQADSSAIDEKQRQREAEAHSRPYGQSETVPLEGAEGTPLVLEKTDSDEPVETSLRGEPDSDDESSGAHERPPTQPSVQP